LKLFILIFLFLTTSCIISEQELLNGTFTGEDNFKVTCENGVVRSFNLSTSVGDLTLSGFWDVIDGTFFIETFSENKTIMIDGFFDSDSTVYGSWEIINHAEGTWEGVLTEEKASSISDALEED